MKLIPVKKPSDIRLPGVVVEFVHEDTTLKEIILRPEGEADTYSIRVGDYGSVVKPFIRRAFETKQVWRITGTLAGLQVQEDCEEGQEHAQARMRDLRNEFPNIKDLQASEVCVRVDEAGERVKTVADSDIPF